MKSGVTIALDQTRISPQWDVIVMFHAIVSLSFAIMGLKYVSRCRRCFLCRATEENAKQKINDERVCVRRPDLRDRDGVRDRDGIFSHVNCTSRQRPFRVRRPISRPLEGGTPSCGSRDPFVANPTTAIRKVCLLRLLYGMETRTGNERALTGDPTRGSHPAPSFPVPFSVSRVFVLRTRHEDVPHGEK
ncbi:hypothetical protein ALC53_12145 [Atta colombica]|uniref:Transmembrane protein n=1 Tax=Atta colombica TaxID=520822 RepID=A0A151HZB9_9HYME|nr:hypothetical protein ALC53_12145 [Atta colombica]